MPLLEWNEMPIILEIYCLTELASKRYKSLVQSWEVKIKTNHYARQE